MKLFWWLVKISLFGLLIFLVACDGSSNSRPKAPIDGNSRPDAELLSLPFDVANDKSREILLSQIKVLKSRIKPLDKKKFKRKYYRHHAWAWSYRARASLLAYRIFGDLEHVEAVLEGALHFAKLPHWKTWQRSTDKWFREITTPGLISIPMIELLLIAQKDSRVRDLISDRDQLLLDAVVRGVSGFDGTFRRMGDSGYYVTPLDGNKVEALNHMALYAIALARLYELTNDNAYRARVGEISRFWLATTTKHSNNTISWPYAPSPENLHGDAEPFWKASVTIELPIAAHRIGIVVTDGELLKIQRIVPQNLFENDKLSNHIYSIDGQKHRSYLSAEKIKKRPSLTTWHLLDCLFPSIDNLDRELLNSNPRFHTASPRSLYGVTFGLYARSNGCRFEKVITES